MELDVQNVSLTLEGRQVFGPVSLTLRERRIGLVGQNGAGKSSFMKLLAGLEQPTTGRVLLDGADIFKDRKAALRGIGVIFQNPDHQILFPTVREEIAFGLVQLGATQKAADAAALAVLAEQGRADWADRACYSLSGGQRHFLCLMAVLAMAPSVIVLDEPYAGLDIPTAGRLRRVLAGLAQSLVMITHDPAALTGFDRVIWLDQGRLVADGAPDVVLPEFEAEMAARTKC